MPGEPREERHEGRGMFVQNRETAIGQHHVQGGEPNYHSDRGNAEHPCNVRVLRYSPTDPG